MASAAGTICSSSPVTCNCSRCRRLGSVLAFAPRESFTLLSGEDTLNEYTFNRGVIRHLFCRTCGIESFAYGQMPDGTPVVAINVNCLDGVDPHTLSLPLSFLHHFAPAPELWRARAMPERRIDMNRMPKSAIDQREALRALPPLIKGYLRLGAFVGDGAVIDHQFGTTDVLIVLPVSTISARYIEHFGAGADRHAA